MNVAIEPGRWCALGSQRQIASSAPARAKSSRWRGDNGSSATRAPLIKTGLKYSTMLTGCFMLTMSSKSAIPSRSSARHRLKLRLKGVVPHATGSDPGTLLSRQDAPSVGKSTASRRHADVVLAEFTGVPRLTPSLQSNSQILGTRRLELTVAASDSSVIVLRIAVSKYEIPPAQARALGGEPAAKSRIRIPARHGRGRGRHK